MSNFQLLRDAYVVEEMLEVAAVLKVDGESWITRPLTVEVHSFASGAPDRAGRKENEHETHESQAALDFNSLIG